MVVRAAAGGGSKKGVKSVATVGAGAERPATGAGGATTGVATAVAATRVEGSAHEDSAAASYADRAVGAPSGRVGWVTGHVTASTDTGAGGGGARWSVQAAPSHQRSAPLASGYHPAGAVPDMRPPIALLLLRIRARRP